MACLRPSIAASAGAHFGPALDNLLVIIVVYSGQLGTDLLHASLL